MPILELLITWSEGVLNVLIRQCSNIPSLLPFCVLEMVRHGWFRAEMHQDPTSWVKCPKLEKVYR